MSMDGHPTNALMLWLDRESRSIPLPEGKRMERSMAELSELKARIAAGEYRLDAGAIADAMFGAADRAIAAEGRSEMLEAGEGDGSPRGVDEL
jgi:Anti-sigma-28 factor, FlgM